MMKIWNNRRISKPRGKTNVVTPEKILEFLDLTKYIKGKSILSEVNGNQVLIQRSSMTLEDWRSFAYSSHLADFGSDLIVITECIEEADKVLDNPTLVGTFVRTPLFAVGFTPKTQCLNVMLMSVVQEHRSLFEVSASAFDNYLKSL